eukprot:TRINITY_DN30422_c0_g1_i1.p1 TRINITY_DN30422_c0_g1~~TRINITY_DN30422_c0_g1_i1.p1  ORF type:complete len:731 (+),score=125.79 TRINITY_DN30422_c0_g1_i1:118-2310(+)
MTRTTVSPRPNNEAAEASSSSLQGSPEEVVGVAEDGDASGQEAGGTSAAAAGGGKVQKTASAKKKSQTRTTQQGRSGSSVARGKGTGRGGKGRGRGRGRGARPSEQAVKSAASDPEHKGSSGSSNKGLPAGDLDSGVTRAHTLTALDEHEHFEAPSTGDSDEAWDGKSVASSRVTTTASLRGSAAGSLEADPRLLHVTRRSTGLRRLVNSIVSSSGPPGKRSSQAYRETFLCPICYENIEVEQRMVFAACGRLDHGCCDHCSLSYVQSLVKEAKTGNFVCFVGTAGSGCSAEGSVAQISEGEIEALLAREPSQFHLTLYRRFKHMASNVHVRDCPACQKMCHPRMVEGKPVPDMQCDDCGVSFCFWHSWAHKGTSCEAYEAQQRRESMEIAELLGSKKCPGCGRQTEKNGGCNHMTCRACECDWCWICGNVIQGGIWWHYSDSNLESGCLQYSNDYGEHPRADRVRAGRRARQKAAWFKPFAFMWARMLFGTWSTLGLVIYFLLVALPVNIVWFPIAVGIWLACGRPPRGLGNLVVEINRTMLFAYGFIPEEEHELERLLQQIHEFEQRNEAGEDETGSQATGRTSRRSSMSSFGSEGVRIDIDDEADMPILQVRQSWSSVAMHTLQVSRGDVVRIMHETPSGWTYGRQVRQGGEGWFPAWTVRPGQTGARSSSLRGLPEGPAEARLRRSSLGTSETWSSRGSLLSRASLSSRPATGGSLLEQPASPPGP